MKVSLIPTTSHTWSESVDTLYKLLKDSKNTRLFPAYFIKAPFRKMGGQILTVEVEQKIVGIGFLFPRALIDKTDNGTAFTLRFHQVAPTFTVNPSELTAQAETLPNIDQLTFYNPAAPQIFTKPEPAMTGLNIGPPDQTEARAVPQLQRRIWGDDADFPYPDDIHAETFQAGTSLVARMDQKLIGFLFGFYKFGGSSLPALWQKIYQDRLRIESQLMGVLPAYRGRQIGVALKKIQAETAGTAGIDIINWTFDPLQYGNAKLNLERLGGVIFDFYPDYYDFRNELNQVPASRFSLTWLIRSKRVKQILSPPTATARSDLGQNNLNLAQNREIERVNDGPDRPRFEAQAEKIAFEVPANWTALQQQDRQTALKWRQTTDQLFGHYLGSEPGQYIVTGVGQAAAQRYLIAERVSDSLLHRLGD